jgi:hypothetical protein
LICWTRHSGVGWCDPALDHAKNRCFRYETTTSQLHALLGSNALLKTMHDLLCPFASIVHVKLLSARPHACIQTSKQAELCRLRPYDKGMGVSTCGRNRIKQRRQAPMLPLHWSPPRSRDRLLRSLLTACSVPSDALLRPLHTASNQHSVLELVATRQEPTNDSQWCFFRQRTTHKNQMQLSVQLCKSAAY